MTWSNIHLKEICTTMVSMDPNEIDLALWNREELLARVMNNEAAIGPLLLSFVEDTPPTMTQIEETFAADDREQLGRAAHTLKGVAANLAAERLRAAAHDLERGAKGIMDLDMSQALQTVRTEYEALDKLFRSLI